MMALLWAGLLLAAEPPRDALRIAMEDELGRVPQLVLPDAKPPYYVVYRAYDIQQSNIIASLGGISQVDVSPNRFARVGVRVGDLALDNGNFEATFVWQRGFSYVPLVLEDEVGALRHDLWLETDDDYKQAVENLARRNASRQGQTNPSKTPSYTSAPVITDALPAAAAFDTTALTELGRSLSARFLDHPGIESSRVVIAGSSGRMLLADTAGSRIQQPIAELDFRVIASARAPDGRLASDSVTHIVRSPSDLPTADALAQEVDALAARLERWAQTAPATETYVGPVIFEGEAAVDLYRFLLAPGLCGTPPAEKARPEDDDGPGAWSLKRHALPAGYSVIDDASADPSLASWYPYDDEGVAPRRVELVSDGIVRALLASRTPSTDAPVSTGHGRDLNGGEVPAVPSHLVVRPPKVLSDKKLYATALKAAASVDLDYVLVVRRLDDPSIAPQAGGVRFFFFGGGGSDETALPAPLEVVRRYADGHEEAVRGLVWQGVDRRILRDIVAAGASTQRTFLWAAPGSEGEPTRGLPVTMQAPSVLLDEVELAPDTSPASKPPRLSSPLATGP